MTTTKTAPTDSDTLEAIKQIGETGLHPALHFSPAPPFASVGIVTGPPKKRTVELITSTRQRVPIVRVLEFLEPNPLAEGELLNRWRPEDVTRFLDRKDSMPTFAEVLTQAREVIDHYLETSRGQIKVLAWWAVASYFFSALPAFPRLDLRGEMGSGKSKAMKLLAALSFNGLLRISPTAPTLFRQIEPLRPTFCLDEIEDQAIVGKDGNDFRAVINSGYQAGARVPRMEQAGKKWVVKNFAVYCPIALAGIAGLNAISQQRAITLVFKKARNKNKLNRDVDFQDPDPRFAVIRDQCYRLALLRWQDVQKTYRAFKIPGALPDTDWWTGRSNELWAPLAAVVSLAEQEGGLIGGRELLDMAKQQSEERSGPSEEGDALASVVEGRMNGQPNTTFCPKDIAWPLSQALGLPRCMSFQAVGQLLTRYGFKSTHTNKGNKYTVTRKDLDELRGQ